MFDLYGSILCPSTNERLILYKNHNTKQYKTMIT
jgi:hypothetical protein